MNSSQNRDGFRRPCLSKLLDVRTMRARSAESAVASALNASQGGRTTMLEVQPTPLSLTDAAAGKLRELTAEETNPNIGLRVYVYSGGCSGFRYGMMIEDSPTEDDQLLESNGVRVYVDGKSVDLLKGSQI